MISIPLKEPVDKKDYRAMPCPDCGAVFKHKYLEGIVACNKIISKDKKTGEIKRCGYRRESEKG